MDVISGSRSSTLNPNAPMFVPYAYRAVEDFSDEWWDLVQSLPWFRDYWLQECFHDPQDDLLLPEIDDRLLPDIDTLFDEFDFEQEEKERDEPRDLISLGALKWRKPRFPVGTPKYGEKAPKIINVKVSPRPIQQPR